MDWFQKTLYTRVLVNITKLPKQGPILRCTFLHRFLDLILNYPTTSSTHSKIHWDILFYFILFQMLLEKRAPPFCQFVFWFGSNPLKICIYLHSSQFFA